MTKRGYVVILVLVVLVVLVSVIISSTRSKENVIVLTDNGFVPSALTIEQGEAVTFVTERGKFFWPASSLHPVHSVYPGFDPKEPVPENESWSFTFNREGQWDFHDHISPYFTGTITVLNARGERDVVCEEKGSAQCWQEKIIEAMDSSGLDAAFDVVERLYKNDSDFAPLCHFVTHNVGIASYGLYLENPDNVLNPRSSLCASGFYHGFMEALIGATGDAQEAAVVCDSIGMQVENEVPDAAMQCYHGIGHGATEMVVASGGFSSEYELIDESIAVCESATKTSEQIFRCVSGVYNTVANLFINEDYGLSVDTSNPLDICAAGREEYKEACYGNMNSVLMWSNDDNFEEAVAMIKNIPDQEQVTRGVWYLALQFARLNLNKENFSSVAQSCRSTEEFFSVCVEGFVQGLLEHGTPGVEYKQAFTFCDTKSFSFKERDACYESALSELSGWYSLEKAESICDAVEIRYQKFCKK